MKHTTSHSRLSIAALAALVALVGASSGARAQESPEAQAGHNLYEQHCMLCHGLRGRGDGEFAAELKVAPADLTLISQRRGGVFPEVELREMIDGRRRVRAHGPANMPIWGEVFERSAAGPQYESDVRDKIDSLLAYLKSIQRPAAAEPVKK
ncbi:MAG: c-type cytochrome [Myxococcota bacterium]